MCRMPRFVLIDNTRTFRFVSVLDDMSEFGVRAVWLSGAGGLLAGAGKVGALKLVASSNA